MIQISVQINETPADEVSAEVLETTARETLHHQGTREGELAILISGDEMLAALNQTYRGIPAPTDVLSFPAGDMPTLPGELPYLGDIAISLPRARAQAAAGGHLTIEELQLLVVHGTLHLLGHDHAEDEEKQRMWRDQAEILARLGLSPQVSPD